VVSDVNTKQDTESQDHKLRPRSAYAVNVRNSLPCDVVDFLSLMAFSVTMKCPDFDKYVEVF